jgi:glyoxylate/hydroxypyruvate reductase
MKNLLPFVARVDAEEADLWITELERAMPAERVVRFQDLNASERASATLAIVANPEPAQLDALPALKWVQSLWAGVERIVSEVKNERIAVVRLQDPQLANTMAEAVLAWTLYLHRDMPTYAAQQAARQWKQLPMRLASERCVAVLGMGQLGRRAAATLVGAGFKVIGWSREEKPTSQAQGIQQFYGLAALPAVLAQADITVCLLPLTSETRGLLNAQRFKNMKAGASVINFGRGAIINTPDLVHSLDRKNLHHAVLDVFETEPLDTDSALWLHPQITVLPHISAPTHLTSAAAVVAQNVQAYRAHGTVPQGINRSQGY